MKKFFRFAAGTACLVIAFSSCRKLSGEGPVIVQQRSINGFSAVASGISSDVFVKQDSVFKVEIQAQQNILDIIETTVVNDELEIRFARGVQVRSHERISIHVSAPVFTGLRLSGSGSLTAPDNINANRLDLKVSGSGNLHLATLHAASLEASISGSGNIGVMSGSAETETIKLSGSGNIDLLQVVAKASTTNTSGSGSVKVFPAESLNVSISGSGSVYYRGNPLVNTSISGSGKVIHLF